jgi:hypothetical protein
MIRKNSFICDSDYPIYNQSDWNNWWRYRYFGTIKYIRLPLNILMTLSRWLSFFFFLLWIFCFKLHKLQKLKSNVGLRRYRNTCRSRSQFHTIFSYLEGYKFTQYAKHPTTTKEFETCLVVNANEVICFLWFGPKDIPWISHSLLIYIEKKKT